MNVGKVESFSEGELGAQVGRTRKGDMKFKGVDVWTVRKERKGISFLINK